MCMCNFRCYGFCSLRLTHDSNLFWLVTDFKIFPMKVTVVNVTVSSQRVRMTVSDLDWILNLSISLMCFIRSDFTQHLLCLGPEP